MILTATKDSFALHPEGIHPAVCVDVIDLGLVQTEFQGKKRAVQKVRIVFETEQKAPDGRNMALSRSFTASLNPKAKLSEFLGKWRGRPIAPGESIDLQKLIGACCTLVISHQPSSSGGTFAGIDAISKPTKKLVPSGCYDPTEARKRLANAAGGHTQSENSRPPAETTENRMVDPEIGF